MPPCPTSSGPHDMGSGAGGGRGRPPLDFGGKFSIESAPPPDFGGFCSEIFNSIINFKSWENENRLKEKFQIFVKFFQIFIKVFFKSFKFFFKILKFSIKLPKFVQTLTKFSQITIMNIILNRVFLNCYKLLQTLINFIKFFRNCFNYVLWNFIIIF